jgi:hypothetical protein
MFGKLRNPDLSFSKHQQWLQQQLGGYNIVLLF